MPSGGTAPYSVTLYAASDLPVGLSFSNGVITGTPSSAGNYLIAAIVGDAAGHFLFKIYPLVVDNAAGEAPGLALSPKPIQIYYEIGSPNPAPIQVAVSTTTVRSRSRWRCRTSLGSRCRQPRERRTRR